MMMMQQNQDRMMQQQWKEEDRQRRIEKEEVAKLERDERMEMFVQSTRWICSPNTQMRDNLGL